VSVIDVGGLREVKQIPVGKYPQRMAVAEVPDGDDPRKRGKP
jgi:hypothetical protein